jgi:hypothetical protein
LNGGAKLIKSADIKLGWGGRSTKKALENMARIAAERMRFERGFGFTPG